MSDESLADDAAMPLRYGNPLGRRGDTVPKGLYVT